MRLPAAFKAARCRFYACFTLNPGWIDSASLQTYIWHRFQGFSPTAAQFPLGDLAFAEIPIWRLCYSVFSVST